MKLKDVAKDYMGWRKTQRPDAESNGHYPNAAGMSEEEYETMIRYIKTRDECRDPEKAAFMEACNKKIAAQERKESMYLLLTVVLYLVIAAAVIGVIVFIAGQPG
ncbi:MAG: hypothetical protein IJ468_06120 [Lachnospiraceae bacterium]|nr:hypothetical protein [Lachnospiraceae bacterium]